MISDEKIQGKAAHLEALRLDRQRMRLHLRLVRLQHAQSRKSVRSWVKFTTVLG